MNSKMAKWLGLITAILVVVGLVFYFVKDAKDAKENPLPKSQEQATNTPTVELKNIEGNGPFKVEVVAPPPPPGVKRPSLTRPVVFSASFNDRAREILTGQIKAAVDELKKNPGNTEVWLDLAVYRKMIDDYKGAEEIWIYLTKILAKPSLEDINLADLYAYFLKDSVKAEMYYKKAIEIEPANIEYYIRAVDFYINLKNDNASALSLAKSGLSQNSLSKVFKTLLEQTKSRVSEGSTTPRQ